MLRSVTAILALAIVAFVYGDASSYAKPFQLTMSDVVVVNKTDGGVCFTTVAKLNTTSPENCGCCITGGCPQCSAGCMGLYGMSWSCCDGMWCCCYPTQGPCRQPGMHCDLNYC